MSEACGRLFTVLVFHCSGIMFRQIAFRGKEKHFYESA